MLRNRLRHIAAQLVSYGRINEKTQQRCSTSRARRLPADTLPFQSFLNSGHGVYLSGNAYAPVLHQPGEQKSVYIETYGDLSIHALMAPQK